jgi:hypothetical protein
MEKSKQALVAKSLLKSSEYFPIKHNKNSHKLEGGRS